MKLLKRWRESFIPTFYVTPHIALYFLSQDIMISFAWLFWYKSFSIYKKGGRQ